MGKSIVKFAFLVIIFGPIMGPIVLFSIGGLYSVFIRFTGITAWFGDLNNLFVFVIFNTLMSPIQFLMGAFQAFTYWRDWILPVAILGGLTAPLFFTIKEPFAIVIQKSAPRRWVVGILAIIVVCSAFAWPRVSAAQEIDARYAEFCTALRENDYAIAYSYMSSSYRHKVSKDKFLREIYHKSVNLYDISFSNECILFYTSKNQKREVVITGDHGSIFFGGLNFVDPFAGGVHVELEKVDDLWYFVGGPVWHGFD